MTIKTSVGTITAPKKVLNILSIGYDKVAESYKKDGLHLIATENAAISHEIYLALDKTGYYNLPIDECFGN